MESATSTHSPASSSRSVGRTKYGKSCINCSKAKCKCSYLPGRPICERCDRLNKQCQPLVSVRRGETQAAVIPAPNNTDTVINAKLDELIHLLKARQDGADANNKSNAPTAASPEPDYDPVLESSLPMHLRLDPTSLAELTDDATAATTFSEIPNTERGIPKEIPIPKVPVSPEQATRCFNRFRQVMLPWLPFMYVPELMTVAELEKTWPTLHLCISVTAATSTSQLFTWSEQLRQTVVKKMYESGERSLDLLLAILGFIGWLRHHRQERPFFNLWLHMAITLVSDLGLDKRAQTDNTWWPWHRESIQDEQTNAEKRALLSVFVLSSISASSIKSVESLAWTPHMDSCLQSLEEHPQWDGDKILAIQVRCCLVTETLNRISQSNWPYTSRIMAESLPAVQSQKTETIIVLEKQLTMMKSNIKVFGLEHNVVVTMSIVTTELDLHEAVANADNPFSNLELSMEDKLSRYNSQLMCLNSWWKVFLSINPEHFPDVSFPVLTQLIHCIVSLFKLRMMQYPGWDRQVVKNTADITEYMRTFADIVERAHQEVGLICDRGDDILIKTSKTMRKLRQYFLNILIMIETANSGPDQLPIDFDETIPDMMDLDFWSSQWLADMIMSWEKP